MVAAYIEENSNVFYVQFPSVSYFSRPYSERLSCELFEVSYVERIKKNQKRYTIKNCQDDVDLLRVLHLPVSVFSSVNFRSGCTTDFAYRYSQIVGTSKN